MPRPLGLAVLALLAALVPSSVAVHQTDDDLNALDLNVVLHHPFPDEKADPWGFAATDVNGTGRDWLGAYYGSSVYPTAIFDGLMIVESVPQKEGAGAYNETYEGYRRIMEVRREAPSALALHVIGSVGGTVEAEATFVPARAWTETGLVPRFVLYEDDVPYNGGNGIFNHRFVVRDIQSLPALDLASGSSVRRNVTFDAARLADPSRAGVVVYVQNVREDSATFKFKEVLQSATWRPGQSGPTHQVSKAVLLEMYSATWCAACVYGDAAADYLANEFGVLSGKVESGRFEYLRPGAPWLLGLGAVAAVAFTWVARGPRRAGPRPPEGHA